MSEQTIYAFAHVETWLEEYAKHKQLNPAELISEVAGMLAATNGVQHSGEAPGKTSGVRRQASGKRNGVSVHGKPLVSKYWGSMTPEQRSKEMQRRRAVQRGEAEPRKRKSHSKFPMGGVA